MNIGAGELIVMISLVALPILLIYYLSVGARHDFLTWHAAFWCVEIFAIVVNLLILLAGFSAIRFAREQGRPFLGTCRGSNTRPLNTPEM